MMIAAPLYPSQCYLGEGPMWHAARQSCFWVDIEGRKFFEYNWISQQTIVRTLDHRVTLIVQDSNDHLILGLEGGIGHYDLDKEKFTWLTDLEKEKDKHRCNDGKVDAAGRLWVGTLHMDFDEGAGSLYCLDHHLSCTKKHSGLTISNGMAWSADNSRFYLIDSPTNKVMSFLFDAATGNIQFEKDAIIIPKEMGAPDGMAIDSSGMLWIAQWGGSGVYRWNPITGSLIEVLELPVPNVSSCAFVGPDLDHLLITTARQDLSASELAKYPNSGDVFLSKMEVRGVRGEKMRVGA